MATAVVGFDALPQAARRAWGGVDLVVGPKGSALDLVLCCALHVSEPRGLVPVKAAMGAVAQPDDPRRRAHRAGRQRRRLAHHGQRRPPFSTSIAPGSPADRCGRTSSRPCSGASAARALDFKLGDSFVGAHGLAAGGEAHDKFPYKVVGILAPTGSALDRLVLTDIETVRYVHVEQAKAEIAENGSTDEENVADLPSGATAVVASYRVPTAAAFMPRQIDATDNLSAASPTLEIARLISYAPAPDDRRDRPRPAPRGASRPAAPPSG